MVLTGPGSENGDLVERIKHAVASKHGHAKRNRELSGAYISWLRMMARCFQVKSKDFPRYGGRGITVCERWRNFTYFLADMGERPKHAGVSIERIDNSGNYEPSNCRWATTQEQSFNRRSNRIIDTPSGPMSLLKAANLYGLGRCTLESRIKRGWPQDEIFKPKMAHWSRQPQR